MIRKSSAKLALPMVETILLRINRTPPLNEKED